MSLEKARRGRAEKSSKLVPPLPLSNGRVKASANAQKGGIVTNPLIIYVHENTKGKVGGTRDSTLNQQDEGDQLSLIILLSDTTKRR